MSRRRPCEAGCARRAARWAYRAQARFLRVPPLIPLSREIGLAILPEECIFIVDIFMPIPYENQSSKMGE